MSRYIDMDLIVFLSNLKLHLVSGAIFHFLVYLGSGLRSTEKVVLK